MATSSGRRRRLLLGIFSTAVFGLNAHAAPETALSQREIVDRYCTTCHNERARTAGLVLSSANLTDVSQNAETWEKVVRKLRAGAMPPHGAPRPDQAALDGLASWLETSLDQAARNPNPGPALLRRLNRGEYGAAVRDLLALDIDADSLLPADDANHGFDNMADSLRISPALLDAYLAASAKVSRAAVGDPAIAPAFTTYHVRPDFGQDAHIEGLPLGTRGGMLVTHTFPLDGAYVFQPRLALNTSAKVRGLDFENTFVITVDGVQVHEAKVGSADSGAPGSARFRQGRTSYDRRDVSQKDFCFNRWRYATVPAKQFRYAGAARTADCGFHRDWRALRCDGSGRHAEPPANLGVPSGEALRGDSLRQADSLHDSAPRLPPSGDPGRSGSAAQFLSIGTQLGQRRQRL